MDLSTRLSSVFGTEDIVDMRRQMVLMRDKFLNHVNRHMRTYFICSGSIGEGVAYPESDDDQMVCLTSLRVAQTYGEASQGDVLMVPSEHSPGYCLLFDVRRSHPGHVIQVIGGMPFLSSSLVKQFYVNAGQSIHGPCLSGFIGIVEYDQAISFSCYSWPHIANAWIARNRLFDWPSHETIQTIIQNGCHVVAIGEPDSEYCHHEWRISFSVAERKLMHSFNHTQFLIYNLLRLTLKKIIGKVFPDVLCSYFMKTALFYTSENTPLELWREDNIESCFKSCLSALYDYVDHRYCPSYFIPEYNMIRRKINRTNRQKMLDIIRMVHTIGIIGVLQFGGESSCLIHGLSVQMMELKVDRDFMISNHLRTGIESTALFFLMLPNENIGCCTLNLFDNWRFIKFSLVADELKDIIWKRGINAYCLKMMDYLFTLSRINKSYQHLHKSLKALLRIIYRADVTTGKLTMATYMHNVGKTYSSLYVIRQLLSEYPPYAIDGHEDDQKLVLYMDVICGRGYTIDSKVRRAYSPKYNLNSLCLNAFPSSLKILLTVFGDIYMDPLTYAYFLESLCHMKHQNHHSLKKSLKCLVNHIHYMKSNFHIAVSKMCVGIVKYVQGETQSTCRWLGSAYIMADTLPPSFDQMLIRSALTYIGCAIKKHFALVG